MGKGFNNYMCKKFFHPASRDNLKRVWMAEQKHESYKKKQDELRLQYEKEQDLYNNKAMLSKESKDKLSVNFMYEPPPGAKKEREREDNEPEYKFEWQRKFNAPREDYCKGDSEIRDQPFGIQVRNVRCIKCHKWGHINTDKECPMYNQSTTSQMLNSSDPSLLIQQMREDGLTIKRSVLEAQQHLQVSVENKKDSSSSDEDDETITQSEKQFLKSLSKKQKLKLLRKLEKLEKKKKLTSKKHKKKDKKKKSGKTVVSSSSSSSSENSSKESDSDDDVRKERARKKKSNKHARKKSSSELSKNGLRKSSDKDVRHVSDDTPKKSKKRSYENDREEKHHKKKRY